MRNRFAIIIFLLLFAVVPSMAQNGTDGQATVSVADSNTVDNSRLVSLSDSMLKAGKPEMALHYARRALEMARRNDDGRLQAMALLQIGKVWAKKGRFHKALAQFSKSMKLKRALYDHTKMANLYHDMSVAFVNLKLYPQALKYHYKAMAIYTQSEMPPGALYDFNVLLQKAKPSEADAKIYTACDSEFLAEMDTIDTEEKEVASLAISNDEISHYFNDGKDALGYGLMVHVKQPAPGKRKTFVRITVVGHVFVTLIKFNTDCSTSSHSFGYYPKRTGLLTATPLHPSDLSTFKNDARHDWDEVVGKLITKRKFDRILQLVEHYKGKKYHLSNSNCTDFGLAAAEIAGINITETVGSWPLGKGNNPGDTGESILEGKVQDIDSTTPKGLFIYNTVKKKKK